jgi:DNA processing protein
MSDLDERIFLLALQLLFYRHPLVANRLLKARGSAKSIFRVDRPDLRPMFGGEEALWRCFMAFDGWDDAVRGWERLRARGGHLVAVGDSPYPAMLAEVYDPPPVLQVLGQDLELLDAPMVAIVGARKGSEHGRRMACEIAEGLSGRGVVVVSGMAYGIDAAAHRGALRGGAGTVAVFGCGLDVIYPRGHHKLYDQIAREGLAITEFPLGTLPYAHHFPQRNRLISGMSLAVVVVEAAKKSGSLITARFALEQGREVYAVPGSAGLLSCRGSNSLIRDGAALVEGADDVAEMLGERLLSWPRGEGVKKRLGHFKIDVGKDSPILDAVPLSGAVTVDQIMAAADQGPAEVLRGLMRLVLEGKLEELPGRRFRRKGE